ncbi:MAG: hypothetical protein WAV09_03230 [Minisyncoccia bacterium]
MMQGRRHTWLDVELEISGPDAAGFFSCNVSGEDITEGLIDFTPSRSYSRERAVAYALQNLAERLIARSRLPKVQEKIGPTELGPLP